MKSIPRLMLVLSVLSVFCAAARAEFTDEQIAEAAIDPAKLQALIKANPGEEAAIASAVMAKIVALGGDDNVVASRLVAAAAAAIAATPQDARTGVAEALVAATPGAHQVKVVASVALAVNGTENAAEIVNAAVAKVNEDQREAAAQAGNNPTETLGTSLSAVVVAAVSGKSPAPQPTPPSDYQK